MATPSIPTPISVDINDPGPFVTNEPIVIYPALPDDVREIEAYITQLAPTTMNHDMLRDLLYLKLLAPRESHLLMIAPLAEAHAVIHRVATTLLTRYYQQVK